MSEHVDKMLSEHDALSFEVIELREALAKKEATINTLADVLMGLRAMNERRQTRPLYKFAKAMDAALRLAGRL